MQPSDEHSVSPGDGPTAAPAGSASEFALEMVNITKEFPGVRALNEVSFQARRGEVHALMGENGAGKSTLMKILDGVYPAGTYRGEIRVNGAAVEFSSPHDASAKGIGYVPQEINVIEPLSVAENIFVSQTGANGGLFVSQRELARRADKFLGERGIHLDPRLPVSALAASQRQLVMIARALTGNPSVLILDESTSSLTGGEADILFRLVRLLTARGVTVLFITHKMDELIEMADRVTVLRDGAVVGNFGRVGPGRGTFEPGVIVAAMVGRKVESFYPPRIGTIGEEEALRVEGLTVAHPRISNRNVVENVGFSVRRGEVLGLAGLVGSGRSETLNAIYGRIPHLGQTYVDGKLARIREPRDAKALGVGLVTEERKKEGLLFNFDIRRNITINNLAAVSTLGLLRAKLEHQMAGQFMRSMNVRAPSDASFVGNLSGGNQQKVVLSKALAANPKVLLLDDPTKGVDVGAKYEIYRLIRDLAASGVALVIVSSELPELLALCDRFVVLWRGKVADQFDCKDANEHRIMVAATGSASVGS